MFDPENQFRETVFKKNLENDPFREANFVFDHLEKEPEEEGGSVFKLHIEEKSRHQSEVHGKKDVPAEESAESNDGPSQKRSFSSIFKDFSRQIIASAVILVVGFFLLNWSAYYQIFKSKWEEVSGTEEVSPLTALVEEENHDIESKIELKTAGSADALKKQIPVLNLDVAPSDNRIIIPRIDQNIPIVRVSSENLIKRDWNALEDEMQNALKSGVVHYPGTSLPGETGNTVITGHSSYFPWDSGRFKDVFALLHQVVKGDKIVIYGEQKKYTYEVTEIKVVLPEDLSILKQTPDQRLTLVTCTPVGTNLKRLIVIAKPVKEDNAKIER